MAQGTLVLFDEFADSIADGRINLLTNTIRVALTSDVVNTGNMIKSAAVPCWGAGGSTNLSTNEVASTGGYTAGGITLGGKTFDQTGGVATFDSTTDLIWTSAGSDPTNIKTAVIYSDTATNKDCIGYIDMTTDAGTTPISLLTGDITLTFNASGIFTLTNP